MGGVTFPGDDDGLYCHAPPELPRRTLGVRLALIGPEQGRGRDVDPFETAIDAVEMRLDEIEHLGAELIDQEGAARTDYLGGRFGDVVADARRQGREGQS